MDENGVRSRREEIYLNQVFRRNQNNVGKKIFESAGGWRRRGGQTKTPGMRSSWNAPRELPDQRRSFLRKRRGGPSKGWNDWTTAAAAAVVVAAATVRGRIKTYWTGSGLRGKRVPASATGRSALREVCRRRRRTATWRACRRLARAATLPVPAAANTERRQLSWAAAASPVLITGRRDNAPTLLPLPERNHGVGHGGRYRPAISFARAYPPKGGRTCCVPAKGFSRRVCRSAARPSFRRSATVVRRGHLLPDRWTRSPGTRTGHCSWSSGARARARPSWAWDLPRS